jgi:RNA polymerase sigma-70 factor (ECF subfamily)
MAYRLSRNWEDAREISQETMFRAFRYLRSFDQERSFKNWFLQIMMNVWRSSPRPLEPESLAELAAAAPLVSPPEALLGSETRSQIMACLDGVSPREREVFLLRDIEEMNVKETARALGISALSVRVRLSSARKKIRLRIEKEFPHLLEGRR